MIDLLTTKQDYLNEGYTAIGMLSDGTEIFGRKRMIGESPVFQYNVFDNGIARSLAPHYLAVEIFDMLKSLR